MFKRLFKPWKVTSVLLVLILFASLYGFIYQQSIMLPSDNWSNPIKLYEYEEEYNYQNMKNRNTLALKLDNTSFVNVATNGKSLSFKSFNAELASTGKYSLDFDFNITEVRGVSNDSILDLILYSKDNGILSFVTISDRKIIKQTDYNTDKSYVHITNTAATISTSTALKVITSEGEYDIDKNTRGTIIGSYAMKIDGETHFIALFNDSGIYKLGKLHDINDTTLDDHLFDLSSQKTLKPTNVAVNKVDNNYEIIVTMQESRYGICIIKHLMIDKTNNILSSDLYEFNSHDVIPYKVTSHGKERYILNLNLPTMGRTEVGKGETSYPNLFMVDDLDSKDYSQLSKSDFLSKKASFITLDGSEYLIYNEQYGDNNVVYMTTDNSSMIAKSQEFTSFHALECFYRTILNYPGLLMYSLPMSMSILLPLIFIIMPLMMLKLEWFEGDTKKVAFYTIIGYNISKAVVYFTQIFNNPKYNVGLPAYLKPLYAHWGIVLILSLITGFICLNYTKKIEGNKNHFKYAVFYILIDLLAINLYFLPYIAI